MRRLYNKKKGTTLIEVLISMAIFSIVTIPLSMMIISSIVNNKKGENKQYAVSVAQQIIEKIRSNNTTKPGIVSIQTDKEYKLKFLDNPVPAPGHDRSYLVSSSDVGNGLEATVTFERKLAYESESTANIDVDYDLSIIMDTHSIKVTGTTSLANITGESTYTFSSDLKICNNNNNTIELKDNTTNKNLGTYKPKDISKDGLINNIQISYSDDYGPHEIQSENNATNLLSVYILKNENNSNINKYTNSKGNIILYDDLPSDSNGIYDISVEIYKGESPNKVRVYSTKTSVSIGI
ncbi:MAG: type IV pilus modification PilV family protein [Clostridium sp.]|uniref:type IV pilus modification PilV family protein n=1 Tax=Clostridium sp. TaxID=1506 RepID=UPI003D6CEEFE